MNPPANVRPLLEQQISAIDEKLAAGASGACRRAARHAARTRAAAVRVNVTLARAAGRRATAAPLFVFVRKPRAGRAAAGRQAPREPFSAVRHPDSGGFDDPGAHLRRRPGRRRSSRASPAPAARWGRAATRSGKSPTGSARTGSSTSSSTASPPKQRCGGWPDFGAFPAACQIPLIFFRQHSRAYAGAEAFARSSPRVPGIDSGHTRGLRRTADGTRNCDEGRTSHRGFASMNAERQRQIASMGGKAVPMRSAASRRIAAWRPRPGARAGRACPGAKRSFSQDRTLAAVAGRKGGQSVPDEKRSFSQHPELAAEAGRKGGQASHGGGTGRRERRLPLGPRERAGSVSGGARSSAPRAGSGPQRHEPRSGGDQHDPEPVQRRELLAEKAHPEERDEHHAELVQGRDARGIPDLQRAEVAPPGGPGRKSRQQPGTGSCARRLSPARETGAWRDHQASARAG